MDSKQVLSLCLCAALFSCKENKAPIAWTPMHYAQNFSLTSVAPGVELLQFVAGADTLRYNLVHAGAAVPTELSSLPQIQVPVSRIISMAAPCNGHLLRLGQEKTIVGLSLKSHVVNPKLRQRIDEGSAVELGQGLVDISPEKLLKLNAQVMVVSAGADASAFQNKLQKINLPLIQVGDYLENHPLGRAEWSLVLGALVDQKSVAESSFNAVTQNYLRLKDLAAHANAGPTIMWGSPYMGSWYIAGGRSYQAQLMRDAGGRYVFDQEEHVSAVPLSFEQVLKKASTAQIWLNPDWTSRTAALAQDSRYELFQAFRGQVWKYDLAKNQDGLYGIYEEGAGRPDLQIQDMIQILHPELKLNQPMQFYRLLP